jgi:hypothetical protein
MLARGCTISFDHYPRIYEANKFILIIVTRDHVERRSHTECLPCAGPWDSVVALIGIFGGNRNAMALLHGVQQLAQQSAAAGRTRMSPFAPFNDR